MIIYCTLQAHCMDPYCNQLSIRQSRCEYIGLIFVHIYVDSSKIWQQPPLGQVFFYKKKVIQIKKSSDRINCVILLIDDEVDLRRKFIFLRKVITYQLANQNAKTKLSCFPFQIDQLWKWDAVWRCRFGATLLKASGQHTSRTPLDWLWMLCWGKIPNYSFLTSQYIKIEVMEMIYFERNTNNND